MFTHRSWGCLLLATVVSLLAPAERSPQRTFYTKWTKQTQGNYYYRTYYYRPSEDSGYRHHYVIYFPQAPYYVYYYDPYRKQYWGRAPAEQGDDPVFSELPAEERGGRLDAISESAFGALGPMPEIPGSSDEVAIAAPAGNVQQTLNNRTPGDLPPAEALAHFNQQPDPVAEEIRVQRLPAIPRGKVSIKVERPKPQPQYVWVTEYETRVVPRIEYVIGYSGFGATLVPIVVYDTIQVPVQRRVRVDENYP